MSEEVDTLMKAREQMVKARRGIASSLAGPFNRENSTYWKATFVELQVLIEAIDRAIADEKSLNAIPSVKIL